MHRFLEQHPDLTVFYNGPQCGASAPDHMHFQAGTSGVLPLQEAWQKLQRELETLFSVNDDNEISVIKGWPSPALLIKSDGIETDKTLFKLVYDALPISDGQPEPMMNIVSWMSGGHCLSVIFPRKKHRPDCYYATGDTQYLISPGAVEMSGIFITPRGEDYERLSAERVREIYTEVSLTPEETASICRKL